MRILHISDLHFGIHDLNLATDLLRQVQELRPRMIICTGDISHDRQTDQLESAYAFLNQLAQHCVGGSPRLIVVPGNHDIRKQGILWGSKAFADVFECQKSDFYCPETNLWIFGFDSAKNGALMGGGEIDLADIDRFHSQYAALRNKHPEFEKSFKIVAVHHHPLPVRWEHNGTQKWLTMTNAGAFLSAVLTREVDLVLHGHEHLQSHARLWSTLGSGQHEVQVMSLGATLRRVDQPEQNWFGLLEVHDRGSTMQHYASQGDTFVAQKGRIHLRTVAESAARAQAHAAKQTGHLYRAVASITEINEDGDARRSIEFDELKLTRATASRALAHDITVPPTSGYLDKVSAHATEGDHGVSVGSVSATNLRPKALKVQLNFDPPLTPEGTMSYTCRWYAVNAFALDAQQWSRLYPGHQVHKNREFTQYIVEDPIDQLTVIAKFPEQSAPQRLRVLVTKPGASAPSEWAHVAEVEGQLKTDRALRYYDSLRVAALRVPHPEQGLSYGIGWEVPPSSSEVAKEIGRVRALIDGWSSTDVDEKARTRVRAVLAELVAIARTMLMQGTRLKRAWPGTVEASFMYLNRNGRLQILSAVEADANRMDARDYTGVSLSFGDGIAGRAFKANAVRLHVANEDDSEEPSFYTPMENVPPHSVLLCIPVQAPQGDSLVEPYGVLSLASARADCPLRDALSASVEWMDRLTGFRRLANERLFEAFLVGFLGYDLHGKGPEE